MAEEKAESAAQIRKPIYRLSGHGESLPYDSENIFEIPEHTNVITISDIGFSTRNGPTEYKLLDDQIKNNQYLFNNSDLSTVKTEVTKRFEDEYPIFNFSNHLENTNMNNMMLSFWDVGKGHGIFKLIPTDNPVNLRDHYLENSDGEGHDNPKIIDKKISDLIKLIIRMDGLETTGATFIITGCRGYGRHKLMFDRAKYTSILKVLNDDVETTKRDLTIAKEDENPLLAITVALKNILDSKFTEELKYFSIYMIAQVLNNEGIEKFLTLDGDFLFDEILYAIPKKDSWSPRSNAISRSPRFSSLIMPDKKTIVLNSYRYFTGLLNHPDFQHILYIIIKPDVPVNLKDENEIYLFEKLADHLNYYFLKDRLYISEEIIIFITKYIIQFIKTLPDEFKDQDMESADMQTRLRIIGKYDKPMHNLKLYLKTHLSDELISTNSQTRGGKTSKKNKKKQTRKKYKKYITRKRKIIRIR